jgi:hypothetical protein
LSRPRASRLGATSQIVVDALTGRLGVVMMTLSYATVAFVLLAYVSTQVYTASLMEDVSRREEQRRLLEERIGLLMQEHAALVSRTRISRYCEDELGMVEADASRVTWIRVSGDDDAPLRAVDRSTRAIPTPELLGVNLVGGTEVMRR